jgi:outer membrane protein OmpA-like peptidoglycan-associated protein
MNMRPTLQASLALLAAATLVACSSVPDRNLALDEARSRHATLQATPQVGEHAAQELARATTALRAAEAAHTARQDSATVDHLAYLARQQVAIAQATATSRAAQAVTTGAAAERDRLRLAVRTAEADQAQRALQTAQQDAQQTAARTEAERAQAARSSEEVARTAQADQARLSASKAQVDRLQEELRELNTLNARNTDRGIVVTLGDLLFDTGQARLQPGGTRSVAQLGQFLVKHPEQRVTIEGHTDSVGSRASNQALSERRAQSVQSALIGMGVPADRLSTVGHGQELPVASNDSAGGRQMNRRVEVVFTPVADAATRR